MNSEEIIRRYNQLVSNRKTLDDTYQAIEKFVVPFRGEFFRPMSSEHEVEWRRRQIYDSTAPNAANLLASQIHGDLTSPSLRWFSLTFRDENLRDNTEAMTWLEACEGVVWQALQESDFNTEGAEVYLDLVSFGNATITEEPVSQTEWKGLNFSAIPVREAYFELDAEGKVLRLYRLMQYTVLQMIDKFGKENIPDDILNGSDDVDMKHDIVFCIYQRLDKKDVDTSKVMAPELRPVGYQYVMYNSKEVIGEEGGYYEMPAFVTPWQRVSGSRHGFSPAMIALSDILQLNEVVAQTSEARAKAIDPATLTTENGLISDLDLNAGGLTIVSSLDEIRTMESSARFDQADAEIDRLQKSINRIFFVDKLELKDSPAMTATEVQVRYERMQRLMGPTLGRIQSNFLEPLIKRTFMILIRAGQMPEMPEMVVDADLDIEYIGPLPRAQKSEQAQSIEMWLNTIASLGELFPSMLDVPNPDEIAKKLGELRGVPFSLMNDEEEVAKMREEKQARQQAQEQMIQMQEGGKAMQEMAAGKAAMGEQDNVTPIAGQGSAGAAK